MAKKDKPAIESLDTTDDAALIGWGRSLYESLVKTDADAVALEKLGRSIFAKKSWGQLDNVSRLIMVRTMLLIQPPATAEKTEKTEKAEKSPDAA